MKNTIAVVIATFNGAKYIEVQLLSLEGQTRRPDEIIIYDDGSTDETQSIIKAFALKSRAHVRFFSRERPIGYTNNFLSAAMLTTCNWVAFCDQDDYWYPDKLETVEKCLIRYSHEDLVMVGHTSIVANERLEPTGQRIPDFRKEEILRPNSSCPFFCIVGFSMICRSSFVSNYFSNEVPKLPVRYGDPFGHDQWLGLFANILGNVCLIPKPLAIWRRHIAANTRPPDSLKFAEAMSDLVTFGSPGDYKKRAFRARFVARYISMIAASQIAVERRKRLTEACSNFKSLARYNICRSKIYASRKMSKRIKLFFSLVFSGAYFKRKRYGLSILTMAKDFCFICFGK